MFGCVAAVCVGVLFGVTLAAGLIMFADVERLASW